LLPNWKRNDLSVVSLVASFFCFLGFVRAWLLWNTNVIVSDEYGYIASAWQGVTANSVLGYRYAFAEVNIWLFRLLSLGNIDRVAIAYPFYIALWSFIIIVSVWSLLKLLGFRPTTIAMTVVFFAITPTFLFLSGGFFTENMALALASLGMYFLFRSLKRPSLPYGPLAAAASAVLFWVAMRSREPYSLLFLGAFLVVLGQIVAQKQDRKKLATVAVVFLIFNAASLYVLPDPVSGETVDSVLRVGQNIEALLFPAHVQPINTTSTTTITGSLGPITQTQTTQTNTQTSFTQTQTTQTNTQTSFTIPTGSLGRGGVTTTTTQTNETGPSSSGGIAGQRTQGLLALLGIHFIPSIAVLRVALLVFVSFVTGYGPLLILLAAGALFLLYDATLGRRFKQWIPITLMVLLLIGTLGGVVLIFADNPSYFGIQHYSTLLRFANTSVLILPLLAAPFVERVTASRLARILLVSIMLVLYIGSVAFLAQVAVTNLDPFEDPLTVTPPTGVHAASVALRSYVLSHPPKSQYLVLGLGSGQQTWAPGLSARTDLVYLDYLNNSAMASTTSNQIIIYVAPDSLDSLKYSYGTVWRLVTNSLSGNLTAVDGLRATGVVFNDDSGTMTLVSRG